MKITKEELKNIKKPYNLSGHQLIGSFYGVEFIKSNLAYTNLCGLDLQWANFREASLFKTDLSNANLHGANFCDVDLRWVSLRDANLERSDLRNANLSGTNLQGANLDYANLHNTNLYNVTINSAQLIKTDLLQFRYCKGIAVAHTSEAYSGLSSKKTIVLLDYESYTIEYWLKNYSKALNNYTKNEKEMYYKFFQLVADSCES